MWGWIGRILAGLVVIGAVAAGVAFTRYPDLVYRFAAGQVSSYREKVVGELSVTEAGYWMPVAKGVERRIVTIERGGDHALDLFALRMDPAHVRIEVVAVKPTEIGAKPIGMLAESMGAIAMMNGSFFNEELGILGLCVSQGREVSPLVKAGDHRGVFAVYDRRAELVERDRYTGSGVTNAIQSGPWLVRDGGPLRDFDDKDRVTRRSAVATDKKGRVIFVVTDTVMSGITLAHFAEVLAMPEGQGGFGVAQALNLDGGTSTQLALRGETDARLIRGFVNVPVLLAVFAR